MFDRQYIGAWDLAGKDAVVRIVKVLAATLTAQGGRTQKKPVIYFKGTDKGFCLNKTNAKTIAAMYGNDTSKWIGQRITLCPTQTSFGNETVDCIRVRPTIPKGRNEQALAPADVDPAMRERQNRAALAAEEANGAGVPSEPALGNSDMYDALEDDHGQG